MYQLIRRHHISFKNAIHGIEWALRTQPNFRVHIILSILAILLGIFLKISQAEMSVIFLTIVFGMGGEMINTSIEEMTDLITTEWKKEAKIAKDVSAGMMLTIAVGALFVASQIFIPKLIVLISK